MNRCSLDRQVSINKSAVSSLPPRGSEDYCFAKSTAQNAELQAALDNLVGRGGLLSDGYGGGGTGTLLRAFHDAIVRADTTALVLLRAMGGAVRLSGVV